MNRVIIPVVIVLSFVIGSILIYLLVRQIIIKNTWCGFPYYCKLDHDQEGGVYKENYINTNKLFFVTSIDKKNSQTNQVYKQLKKDLGSMFKPVILEKWKGHGVAYNKIIKKIRELPDDSLIFVMDSLDILAAKEINSLDIIRSFNKEKTNILISGERGLRTLNPHATTEKPTQGNTGFYGGYKQDLLAFMREVIKTKKMVKYTHKLWRDQTATQIYLMEKTPRFNGKWKIDTESKFIHTCAFETGDDFKIIKSKVYHKPTGRLLDPFFYHGPGNGIEEGVFKCMCKVRNLTL
jgi:glycosyltransferase involved in cell wall biosynthesis